MGNTRMQTIGRFLYLMFVVFVSQAALAQGQSITLMSDGSTLILGGLDSHSLPTNAAVITDPAGTARKLSGMIFPRDGHTATVLPDGTVLIFGGIGTDGQIVTAAELFDPETQQFSVLKDVLAVPRAFHSATVLTDGTVLLAGGILAGGQFPADVQLLDSRSEKALSQHALLSVPREGHVASLLSDGSVFLSGGKDHFGSPVHIEEVDDPVAKRFSFASPSVRPNSAHDAAPVQIAASIPEDGAAAVQILPLISFRFSQLLDVKTANATSFVLTGPDGKPVPARISASEAGRLVFVIPDSALAPGSHYILNIKGASTVTGE